MKIKVALLATLVLAFGSIGFAQSKTKTIEPNGIVKNLYANQKTGSGLFFQTKSRAFVDKYFRKDLADLIWNDSSKERMVSFQFKQSRDKSWKIYDVHYRSNDGQVTLAENLIKASASQISVIESDVQEIKGELQVGKTRSLILYVGMESGDYAAYCFANNSEAGRKILTVCKNRKQCAVKATVADYACKVPGLEADLSYSARIVKVQSVKALGRKR
jgi:hypothetical protein